MTPRTIHEGDELQALSEWTWGLESVAALAALADHCGSVVMDQITKECAMQVSGRDDGLDLVVTIFGDFFATFDLSDALEDYVQHFGSRDTSRAAPRLLRGIADKIEGIAKEVEAEALLSNPPVPKTYEDLFSAIDEATKDRFASSLTNVQPELARLYLERAIRLVDEVVESAPDHRERLVKALSTLNGTPS